MTDIEVVRATVRGVKDIVAMSYISTFNHETLWFTSQVIENTRLHADEHVTDRVLLRLVDESKLVVIDPNGNAETLGLLAGQGISGLRVALRSMLKPVEPPIPPEPEGQDWVAIDAQGQLVSDAALDAGWEKCWKARGPLTVYRREL